MENLNNNKNDFCNNTVSLYNREKMDISGAVEVLSSTENEVIAKVCDFMMIVIGNELRVSKFVPEEKFLSIVGKINGIKYENKVNKKSFLKKVFK